MVVDLARGELARHERGPDDWIVHLPETGLTTNTGGRVKRLQPYLADATLMLTYGDGVGDIDLHALLRFHRAHGRIATLTAVRPRRALAGW